MNLLNTFGIASFPLVIALNFVYSHNIPSHILVIMTILSLIAFLSLLLKS